MRFCPAALGALALLALAGCATRTLPPPPKADRCDRTPAEHRVQRGDTLFRIGWTYCLSPRDIAAWNRLKNPDLILVGQRLRLRPPGTDITASAAVAEFSKPPSVERPRPTRLKPAQRPAVVADRPRPAPTRGQVAAREVRDDEARTGVWRWPARGDVVSQFNPKIPGRNGIRISADRGQPVRAAANGQIVYTGNSLPGYGTLIIVEHSNGLLSAYGHLGRMLVKQGDQVNAGDVIAELGNGDRDVTTLHFEIRKNGQPVNPLRYLPS